MLRIHVILRAQALLDAAIETADCYYRNLARDLLGRAPFSASQAGIDYRTKANSRLKVPAQSPS